MENLSKNIDKMLKPYREIEKIIKPAKDAQSVLKPALELHKSLEVTLQNLQKSFRHINRIYASIPKFENPILEHLDTFKEIGNSLKNYTEETSEDLLIIAQHGWFIELDSEIYFPSLIAEKFNSNKILEGDDLMIEYYSTHLDLIFDNLIKRHPNRKEFFLQALKSYRSGNHYILIPSLLSQIDGICFDFTKKKFFIKEKKNKYLPQVTAELEKSADNFLNLYLSPLQNQTPIMAREESMVKFPCSLNRHEILHGISTNYGTKINSLKVLSLLKYLSDLLTDLDRKTLNDVTALS